MKQTKTLFSLTTKALFHLSWLSTLYFLFIALDTLVIKSHSVIVSYIREIITIPLIFAQVAICIWSLNQCIKGEASVKELVLWLFIISFCNSVLTIISFFL